MSFLLNPYQFGYNSERSVVLDGVNEYVSFGNISEVSFDYDDPHSFSFWVNSASQTNPIIVKAVHASNYRGWAVFQVGLTIRYILRNTVSSNEIIIDADTTITASVWNHVVVTYDGSNSASGVSFYINGSSSTTTTTTDNLTATTLNSESFNWGRRGTALTYFAGKIDEVVIYNTELTSDEAGQLYGSGCPVNPLSLSNSADVVFYGAVRSTDDMTAGTGSIKDYSGNGNDGTPLNTESGDLSTDIPTC